MNRTGKSHRVWLTAIVLGLSVSMVAPAEEPMTSLGLMRDRVQRIRSQLKNVSVRLHGKVKKVRAGASKGKGRTPALGCCGKNLEMIEKRLGEFAAGLRELRSCYRETGATDALTSAGVLRVDAENLHKSLQTFGGAGSKNEASGALGLVQRLFLLLVEDMEPLEECSSIGESSIAPPEPSDPGASDRP